MVGDSLFRMGSVLVGKGEKGINNRSWRHAWFVFEKTIISDKKAAGNIFTVFHFNNLVNCYFILFFHLYQSTADIEETIMLEPRFVVCYMEGS